MLRDASKVIDACEYLSDAQEKTNCQAQAVKPAQDVTFANEAHETSVQRAEQIESLMDEIKQNR
ncbi:minor pilin of type IV secretion complex [Vibrio astriarenae]|nr:minor pilin of type IV secretion complex [Vibrio sp. C7]